MGETLRMPTKVGTLTASALGRSRRSLLGTGLAALSLALFLNLFATGDPVTTMSIKCPAGEVEDLFTGVCLPKLPPSIIEMTTQGFGGQPEIDGVPCTGENSNECIGLAEEQIAQGPTPSPHATWTSSP